MNNSSYLCTRCLKGKSVCTNWFTCCEGVHYAHPFSLIFSAEIRKNKLFLKKSWKMLA